MANLAAGEKLILPSPNGSTLSTKTAPLPTVAACLRNASAAARLAASRGQRIAVIAAGERWSDGTLRPAFEDQLGAGAVIAALNGKKSPEADAAVAVFLANKTRLHDILRSCASGRELIHRGFPDDVALASEFDVTSVAPFLNDGLYYSACDAAVTF